MGDDIKMPILFKSKRDQYMLTLPKSVCEAKGFHHRQEFDCLFDQRGDVLLRPKKKKLF